LPVLKVPYGRKRRDVSIKQLVDSFLPTKYSADPAAAFGYAFYCKFIQELERKCLERTILDLWKYDRATIEALSKEQIIHKLNTTTERSKKNYCSLWYGQNYDTFVVNFVS
jgi:hypothetical protein